MRSQFIIPQLRFPVSTQEEWRDINGWDGFQVSNFGHVRRIKMLTPFLTNRGYVRIAGCRAGKLKELTVHRLVAAAFLGPAPFPRAEVNHIDGDKENNVPSNLEWVTGSANKRHALATGLWRLPMGSRHPNAKLTEEDIIEIRRLRGQITGRAIARMFGVHPGTIAQIQLGHRWRHV